MKSWRMEYVSWMNFATVGYWSAGSPITATCSFSTSAGNKDLLSPNHRGMTLRDIWYASMRSFLESDSMRWERTAAGAVERGSVFLPCNSAISGNCHVQIATVKWAHVKTLDLLITCSPAKQQQMQSQLQSSLHQLPLPSLVANYYASMNWKFLTSQLRPHQAPDGIWDWICRYIGTQFVPIGA